MALHLKHPQPLQRGAVQFPREFPRLNALHRLVRDLLRHIRAARLAGKATRRIDVEQRRREADRRRIGAESLAVNVRAATGNYGKPKPR